MTGTRDEARKLAEQFVNGDQPATAAQAQALAHALEESLARENAERARAKRAEAALRRIAAIGAALPDPGDASAFSHHTRSVASCIARDALAALSARPPGEEAEA